MPLPRLLRVILGRPGPRVAEAERAVAIAEVQRAGLRLFFQLQAMQVRDVVNEVVQGVGGKGSDDDAGKDS